MLHGEVVVDQGLSSLVTLASVPFETCCVQLRQFSEGMGGRFVDERVLGRELLVETTVGQPRRLHQVGDAEVSALLSEQTSCGFHDAPTVLFRLLLRYAAHHNAFQFGFHLTSILAHT